VLLASLKKSSIINTQRKLFEISRNQNSKPKRKHKKRSKEKEREHRKKSKAGKKSMTRGDWTATDGDDIRETSLL